MAFAEKFFPLNKETRDEYIRHSTRMEDLFNDFIDSGNHLAVALNSRYRCEISTVQLVNEKSVLIDGPVRL